MANAGGVRAGQCYVEIHANDTHFQRGMVILSNRMQAIGQRLRNFGAGLGIGAAAIGAPIIGAIRATASFEDALLEMQAATSELTPDQFRRVHDEALRMSGALGVAPERIAEAFARLIQAGMSVDDALGGAAETAVQFAQISKVDAEAAAIFMKNAMYMFGVSAKEAADTLSAASDSSATSIAELVQAFGLIGSSGAQFNQSLFGISRALAYLSNWSIKGEEAGTGLKTLLIKLISPSNEANKALARYGLTVRDFRNEARKLLPIAQIAEILREKMARFGDEILKDKTLVDVFMDRGVKVISAFAKGGKKAVDDVGAAMENSRSVSEKFAITMSGLSGFFTKVNTAVKLLSIGFSEGLSASLNDAGDSMIRLGEAIGEFFRAHPILARLITYGTAIAAAMAAVSFSVGVLFTGVAQFLAGGVLLTRWFDGIITWSPRVAAAFGRITAAVGGLSLATRGLGLLGLLALGFQAGQWIGNQLFPVPPENGAPAPAGGAGFDRAKVTPDPLEKPMGGGGGAAAVGANHGTFSAAVAEQIGIGPSIDAANRTANASERAADNLDEVVGMMRGNPADLQAGMQAAWGGGGTVAPNGRDMIDAAEKTAIESKKTNDLLAALVRAATEGGLQFA